MSAAEQEVPPTGAYCVEPSGPRAASILLPTVHKKLF